MTKAIIFDIDGTLADLGHRRHLVSGDKPQWGKFFDEMVSDPPLVNVCMLADLLGDHPLVRQGKIHLFLFSGRPESHREMTETWLSSNVPVYFRAATALRMRAEGDTRADTIIKKEMLDALRILEYDVALVVDDRPSVVRMWREEGITCLAMDADEWNGPKNWEVGSVHFMIGPSCAGKSSALKTAFGDEDRELDYSIIISSDKLQIEIAGDIGEQDVNDQVYAYMAAALKVRVEHGLTTIIDATNIHARSRRPLLDSCPKDTSIWYHIYDRPLHEKERDAGWRKDIMIGGKSLIRSHHESFKGALPTILAGDNDPRVTVIDHRRTK